MMMLLKCHPSQTTKVSHVYMFLHKIILTPNLEKEDTPSEDESVPNSNSDSGDNEDSEDEEDSEDANAPEDSGVQSSHTGISSTRASSTTSLKRTLEDVEEEEEENVRDKQRMRLDEDGQAGSSKC